MIKMFWSLDEQGHRVCKWTQLPVAAAATKSPPRADATALPAGATLPPPMPQDRPD